MLHHFVVVRVFRAVHISYFSVKYNYSTFLNLMFNICQHIDRKTNELISSYIIFLKWLLVTI